MVREIIVKIDKETLKASIDMEGYDGAECNMDYTEIMKALEATPELVVDKTGVLVEQKVSIKS